VQQVSQGLAQPRQVQEKICAHTTTQQRKIGTMPHIMRLCNIHKTHIRLYNIHRMHIRLCNIHRMLCHTQPRLRCLWLEPRHTSDKHMLCVPQPGFNRRVHGIWHVQSSTILQPPFFAVLFIWRCLWAHSTNLLALPVNECQMPGDGSSGGSCITHPSP